MESSSPKKNAPVRVRVAPSPTGTLHVGTARTALFNYLFARKHGGVFLVRIEDTDKERSKKEFELDIMSSLSWLGLDWDEGPLEEDGKEKGAFGPYRQSERTDIYRSFIRKLLKEDRAYHCFCTSQELEAQKQYYASLGKPWKYSGTCAKRSKEEQERLLKEGKPSIIRFRTKTKKIAIQDLIRGHVEFSTDVLEDFSIAKNEETPLYNLAVVIDDHEMQISHVIRGEDHIPNTPKQILLQEALEFQTPSYAHIPLLLAPDRSKISKRKGAVSVKEYREMGYLPEALVNFLALLGWNPDTEKEIFSLSSLVKEFSIEQVHKSGAIFDIQKLDFLNGSYIRQKSDEEFTELCIPYLVEQGLLQPTFSSKSYPPAYGGMDLSQKFLSEGKEEIPFRTIVRVVSLYKERVKRLSEVAELVDFFFKRQIEYPQGLLSWKGAGEQETIESLQESLRIISSLGKEQFSEEFLEKLLLQKAEEFSEQQGGKKDRGKLLWPLRAALSGKKASAPPFALLAVLGKEKSIERINNAITSLSSP